jgi:hypothetical protein
VVEDDYANVVLIGQPSPRLDGVIVLLKRGAFVSGAWPDTLQGVYDHHPAMRVVLQPGVHVLYPSRVRGLPFRGVVEVVQVWGVFGQEALEALLEPPVGVLQGEVERVPLLYRVLA